MTHTRCAWAPAVLSAIVLAGYVAALYIAMTRELPHGSDTLLT